MSSRSIAESLMSLEASERANLIKLMLEVNRATPKVEEYLLNQRLELDSEVTASHISSTSESVRSHFTAEQQADLINQFLKMKRAQAPPGPLSPERATSSNIKRELNSPDTPHKGKSRKVQFNSILQSSYNLVCSFQCFRKQRKISRPRDNQSC